MNKIIRCFANNENQKLYQEYHDNEWGVPVHDDNLLFENLILEGAQAGLSYETVLKKRESYRKAFYNFNPIKVANMSDKELEELYLGKNPQINIIKNKLKIWSTRTNAQIFLTIQKELGSFDNYIWNFTNQKIIKNSPKTAKKIPSSTTLSDNISKDLKKRGMKFVGSTIVYAYLQAIGIIDDHIIDCICYKK